MATENHYKIKYAILDFDNTIASWTDYAVPAYFAMAEALCQATGLKLNFITQAMRKVYEREKTIEYAPLVQEMDILKDRNDIDELVKVAKTAFSKVKRKHLKLYPGIKELLTDLKRENIDIYILTDAPYIQAAKRAERLEISHFIHGLIGLPSPPAEKIHPTYRKPKLEFPFKTAVSSVEKPYTNLLEIINKVTEKTISKNELKSQSIFIGDNPLKDGVLMKIWGLFGYLAEYGKPDLESIQKILRFAPENISKKNLSSEQKQEESFEIDPNHKIVPASSVEIIREDLKKRNYRLPLNKNR